MKKWKLEGETMIFSQENKATKIPASSKFLDMCNDTERFKTGQLFLILSPLELSISCNAKNFENLWKVFFKLFLKKDILAVQQTRQ